MGIQRRRVQVITSRLKAFASFLDPFSYSGSLKNGWKTLSGSWSTNGSDAVTSTAASSYPVAVVKMAKSNVTASLTGTTNGAGVSIWATDSGNWWGVVTGQNAGVQCNCTQCQQCNASTCNQWQCNASTCTSWYTVCNSWVPLSCSTGGGYCQGWVSGSWYACGGGNCSAAAPWNSYNCTRNGTQCGQCTSWNAITNCYSAGYCYGYNAYYTYGCTGGYCGSSQSWCNAANCNASSCIASTCNSVSYYDCAPCYTCYPATIRVIKSVASVVSELTSWIVASAVQSIKVITSGTTVTTKAYSDNSLTTQIGSDLVYTDNNAAITTQFGIVIAPSTYSQGASISGFEATTN